MGYIDALVKYIKIFGLLQPMLIISSYFGKAYELLAAHGRMKACMMLGRSTIRLL